MIADHDFKNGFPEELFVAGFEIEGPVDMSRGMSGAIEVRSLDHPAETVWLELLYCRLPAQELRKILKCAHCTHVADNVFIRIVRSPDGSGNHEKIRLCRGCERAYFEIETSIHLAEQEREPQ